MNRFQSQNYFSKILEKNNMIQILRTIFISIFFLFLTSCNSSKDFTHTVDKIDIQKYMGTWYVIESRPTFLEKDAYNAIEHYTWNTKENRIDIDFSYTKGSLTGPLKHIYQKGWIYNHATNAYWKISPIWPLKFSYLIIAIDSNYEWTVVGVPDQKYLWIMARTPKISTELLNKIKNKIKTLGYSTDNMEMVKHNDN